MSNISIAQRSRNIAQFESSLEKIGRIFSEQYGVHVVFNADRCCTDGKTIYLPSVPPNAPQEFIDAIHGFLDHEVGHVIFSDMSVGAQLKDPKELLLLNALEDARIEARMCKMWKGCAINLNKCSEFALTRLKDAYNDVSPFGKYCVAAGLVAQSKEDHWFYKDLVEDEYKDYVHEDWDLVKSVTSVDNTTAVLEIVRKILETTEELSPPEMPQPDIDDGDCSASANPGSKGKSPGSLDLRNGNSPCDSSQAIAEMARVYIDAYQPEDKNYLIYTTEGDKYEVAEVSNVLKARTQYQVYLTESQKSVGALQTRLRMRLLSLKHTRYRKNLEEGSELHTPSLPRFLSLDDPRIYKRRIDTVAVNARIVFMVDHSGSMAGFKLNESRKCIIQLAEAINGLKIPFAIYGYSTVGFSKGSERYNKADPKSQAIYTRWGDLNIIIYKTFEDGWSFVKHRLSNFLAHSNTYNGESVAYGAKKLFEAAKPGERLIMFDFMDGMPQPNRNNDIGAHTAHLIRTIASLRKLGVELIGVGIGERGVDKFYGKDAIIVDDAAQLATVGLSTLERILIKRN